MIVALLAALVALQTPPPGFALAGNADDETDSTCIQATALAIQHARGADLDNLLFVNAFYTGRLSGRATDPAWQTTVGREADKSLDLSNIGPVIVRCGQRMRAVLKAHN